MSLRSACFISVLFISALSLLSCSGSETETIKESAVSLQEVWTVNETGLDSEIFGYIAYMDTDSQNNLYVVDPTSWKIRSWDADGNYRWSAGTKGQGPEEIGGLASMYVHNDTLRLFDSGNLAIHTFDTDGVQFESVYLPEKLELFNAAAVDNNIAVIPYLDPADSVSKILHILDIKSGTLQQNFSDLNVITDAENTDELFMMFSEPGAPVFHNGSILYSTAPYDGSIHVYNRTEGKWLYSETMEGYDEIVAAYSLESTGINEDYNETYHIGGVSNDMAGYVYMTYESYSYGLYPQNNGSIIHLSLRNTGDREMELIAEEFDNESGKLVRYGRISELSIPFEFSDYSVIADRSGNLYFADRLNVSITKYELNWGESDDQKATD